MWAPAVDGPIGSNPPLGLQDDGVWEMSSTTNSLQTDRRHPQEENGNSLRTDRWTDR